jgi:hypothetical protein
MTHDSTFETNVLNTVKSVTNVGAYFSNGTLFLETFDSNVATSVFNKLYMDVTEGICFGKVGSETYYDFI